MPDRETFDFIVIGAGPAGSEAAGILAGKGRVALVERDRHGGTCLNRGCIPTKARVAAARRFEGARKGGGPGVAMPPPSLDPVALWGCVARTVAALSGDMRAHLARSGVVLVAGEASALPDGRIEVRSPGGATRTLE